MNCIYILLTILIILIICSLFSFDHFKPINSLNIKFNSKNIRIPRQLKKPNKNTLSIKEKINSELHSSPLIWQNQMYSNQNYSHVGPIIPCLNNYNCHLTSECNFDANIYDRKNGVGVCTLREPDKTVFDIKI